MGVSTQFTSVSLPDTMTSIGKNVFVNCSKLETINLHDGITSIGDRAFLSCTSLTNINRNVWQRGVWHIHSDVQR